MSTQSIFETKDSTRLFLSVYYYCWNSLSVTGNRASRYPHRDASRTNVRNHHGIGPDNDVGADANRAEDFRTRSHYNLVSNYGLVTTIGVFLDS
ncbi:hypothetical protein Mal65_42980 [Crateriforma conspicua]|nr:hypothetical protein Mal65_42980 [Crateriforma conspicua]